MHDDDEDSEIGEEQWLTQVTVEFRYTSLQAAAQSLHDRIVEPLKRGDAVDDMERQMSESIVPVEVRLYPNPGPLWNGVVARET
jgi:hypothetical protein